MIKKVHSFYGTRRFTTVPPLNTVLDCKVDFIIVFPSKSRSCKCALFRGFPPKRCIFSLLPYVHVSPSISCFFIWDPNEILGGGHIMKLHIVHPPVTSPSQTQPSSLAPSTHVSHRKWMVCFNFNTTQKHWLLVVNRMFICTANRNEKARCVQCDTDQLWQDRSFFNRSFWSQNCRLWD